MLRIIYIFLYIITLQYTFVYINNVSINDNEIKNINYHDA